MAYKTLLCPNHKARTICTGLHMLFLQQQMYRREQNSRPSIYTPTFEFAVSIAALPHHTTPMSQHISHKVCVLCAYMHAKRRLFFNTH